MHISGAAAFCGLVYNNFISPSYDRKWGYSSRNYLSIKLHGKATQKGCTAHVVSHMKLTSAFLKSNWNFVT